VRSYPLKDSLQALSKYKSPTYASRCLDAWRRQAMCSRLDPTEKVACSLLSHEWGLNGYRYHQTDYLERGIVFTIEPQSHQLRCGGVVSCGKARSAPTSSPPPIGGKPVQLKLPISRLSRPSCDKTRQVKLYFADEHVSHTHAFKHSTLDLSQRMTK